MDKRCYCIGEEYYDRKELEENPIDLEEEFLDVNISTFGKFSLLKI